MIYLVDSAGGRLTSTSSGFFSDHRGASRIFHLQVALSGRVPQICCLLGPSAAGGAYMPAFTNWVGMVEGNASMYLASPRVAEKVTGERSTLEEMGGALMHASVSGCADEVFGFGLGGHRRGPAAALLPARQLGAAAARRGARGPSRADWSGVIPAAETAGYDVGEVIDGLVDAGSFFEIKARWAQEMVTGLARLDGRVVGIVANQPQVRSGAIFVDSADKAARFITMCDAFNVPLLFLHDVPGFMVGVAVERQGIIRHGAKMITAMASAEVPKFSVILRKSYAAGYYAMCAPGFGPRASLALPTAVAGPMAAEASVNAMYAKKIAEIGDPAERGFHRRAAGRTARRSRPAPAGQRAGGQRRRGTRRAARRAHRAAGRRAGLDPRPAAQSTSHQPGLGGCPWQTISASCWPPRCSRCASSGARLPRPSCSAPPGPGTPTAQMPLGLRSPNGSAGCGRGTRCGPASFGDFAYFAGGQINVADNCVDRWAQDPATAGRAAVIWEGEPGDVRTVSYAELAGEVSQLAGALASLGVTKGNVVAIYMPNAVEAFTAVHACNRIGAIYTILFSGFGPDAVLSRLEAARAKVVIVLDASYRRGKLIPLQETLRTARARVSTVEHTIVVDRTGRGLPLEGGEISYADALSLAPGGTPAVPLEANDPAFLIFTSGTKARPRASCTASPASCSAPGPMCAGRSPRKTMTSTGWPPTWAG